MTRTNDKVGYIPESKLDSDEASPCTPQEAAQALRLLEGKWKMFIIFNLFGAQTRRFSELERLIDGITQKMLIQQLRDLERDGIIGRTVYPQVPPKVEYFLTDDG